MREAYTADGLLNVVKLFPRPAQNIPPGLYICRRIRVRLFLVTKAKSICTVMLFINHHIHTARRVLHRNDARRIVERKKCISETRAVEIHVYNNQRRIIPSLFSLLSKSFQLQVPAPRPVPSCIGLDGCPRLFRVYIEYAETANAVWCAHVMIGKWNGRQTERVWLNIWPSKQLAVEVKIILYQSAMDYGGINMEFDGVWIWYS